MSTVTEQRKPTGDGDDPWASRRRKNVAAEPAPIIPHLTTLPDPFEPLAAIRERVDLDCRCGGGTRVLVD